MHTTRFATSLAMLCLTALSAVTACAQWVPCTKAGVAIISPIRDNNNCYPMYGLITGSGSGSQSAQLAYPNQNMELYNFIPMAPIIYDPYDPSSMDLSIATTATASNGLKYDGYLDADVPVSSQVVGAARYSWNAYFVWQGQTPPTGPSANFLLVTTVSATAAGGILVMPGLEGLSASSTASNSFGEAENAQYIPGRSVNNVLTGRHIINVAIVHNSSDGYYYASLGFSGGTWASAANTCTTFPNGALVGIGSGAFIGGGVLPQ